MMMMMMMVVVVMMMNVVIDHGLEGTGEGLLGLQVLLAPS